MTEMTPEERAAAEDASVNRNLMALVLVALFVGALFWVVNSFKTSNTALECMESGHHNCVPLDTSVKGR